MLRLLFIPLTAAAFFLSAAPSGIILYSDKTTANLPIAAVTGPNMDMETIDIENDGDLDIVLAREFAPNKLLINNGNGVYTDGTIGRLPQFSYDSEDIGIADFDNDNDADIVFASEDNGVHELYFNDGNGVFRNMNNRLPGSIANSVLARDINNDNRPDIIFGNAGQDFILISNGDSTFTNETASRLPASTDITQDLKLADIDDDGDNDLIAGNEDGNKIYINNGSGVFTDETSLRLPPSSVEETRKVTLADVDGDDDLDVFFANVAFRPGRTLQDRLLLNDGKGFFTDVTATNIPADNEHTCEGIFVDVDYDNDVDLITSNIFFDRPMRVFLNDGKGVFTEATSEILPPGVIAEGIGVKADDFNDDGLTDLYLINRHTSQQAPGLSDRLLLRNDTATVGIGNGYFSEVNGYELYQNYPNPFNPSTKLNYNISKDGNVKISLYDIKGTEIAILVNEKKSSGYYSINIDGAALNLSSGMYFVQMSVNEFKQSVKIVLAR